MSKNTARIARDAFAEGAISLLRRALAEGLGAHILVDPHGVMTHADLHDADGAELLSLKLHATQLALPLAPKAPAPSQPPAAVEAPADVTYPLAVGDRIILDGVAVEVLGVDDEGFLWREDDPDAVALDEGETMWAEVQHVAGNVWVPRSARVDRVEEPPAVEAPKPAAKKPRAKKATAKAVEPSPVEEAAARPGLWLLVEHPVGAPPVEMRHEERLARRFFEATAKHGGDGLRRVELFDADGLLVDSHNFAVAPMQRGRTADEIPTSVPAHLRDLAALTSPGWWCVVAQPAVRPDLTEAKLCTDESTASATAAALRAADEGSNSLTRVVVFDADGAVHTAWHRHEPAVCVVVEAHQGVELFRVTMGAAMVFGDTPPAEWGASVAPCRYAESHMRNSPAEVSEGPFSLHWHPDVAAREVYAIVPRLLVAVVVRRCTTWGGGHHPTRVTPELDAPSTALRAGSSVVVGGETWSVLLVDHERAVLTRGDEVAEVALGDVHPSGTDAGWWADRVRRPKTAEKKAPKRAKAVA